MHGEFDRYLDLFTQLNIIEDSFEFVHLIFHFDPFQCVYAGNTFKKIYGYSCKEFYNRTDLFYETTHPDDVNFLMQQIKLLIKNGYHEFSYRIITKNSEVKYLKTNAWYQKIEGESYVMTCFQKDVTLQMETGNRLKKSLQRHHHISDIAITLNSTDDFEYKLQLAVDKIGNSVQSDQVSLYEIDNEQMVCRYIWSKHDPIIPQGIVEKIPPLNHLPEYINTLQFSEGEEINGFMRCWKRPERVQSLLLVPIRIKKKMFGFIEIVSVKKRKWKDDDFSFVNTVGNITANFYDRKTIDNELNLNYLNQELLANVSYKLNQFIDDNKQALKKVLGYIGLKNPDIERVFICKYDEENNLFRKSYEYSNPSLNPKYLSQDECDGLLFTNIFATLKKGKPFCVSHISQLSKEVFNYFQPLFVQSVLVAPLFVNSKFYGVFGYLIYSRAYDWNKSEIETAQSFACSISHFIERQTIMKKLKNSEKRFKDISAKFPGCIFQATLSPTEDITMDYISPQFGQWSGIKTFSKTSLKKIQQTIHPNDLNAFFKVKEDLECLHPEISYEGRFYFPSVGFKWLIVKASMLEIKPSGELIYNGLLIDTTKNKQTELKLADANVSIQSIINNLEVGILLVNDNNNVLYSNEKMVKLLGADFDMNNGQTDILDASFNLVRDNISLKAETRDLMKKRLEEREKELFFNKTAEFYTRDYIPIFRGHKFFAHLFIFRNVTHLRMQEIEVQKSYQRVRAIIDHSDVGVVLLSENEKVMIVNNRFLQMFQILEPANNFVNQFFRDLWEKMCDNVYIEGITREQIRDAVYSGKRMIEQEIIINEVVTMKCSVEPVVYDNHIHKEIHETIIRVIDVTSQKNIEQTLRKAKEEAEEIAKTKSHILTSMSHEIRTPLNGILGFSVMLKDMLADPYHREMAEVIDQSGRRLLDTINSILDFSMLQSDKKSFKIMAVNVNQMLQEQINVHKTMALHKRLYLYAQVNGAIGIAVAERGLYKILSNLINNAIKYTVTGGVKVEIGIVRMDGNDWLDIKVIDTGVGIDEVMHRTIFEPFRQGSEGYGRAFEGTGLGLSLVKEYVQKLNGTIHLVSRRNEGSTFKVLLPNAYYENNNKEPVIIGILPDNLS